MLFKERDKKGLVNFLLKKKMYLLGPGFNKDFLKFISYIDKKNQVVVDVNQQANQIIKVSNLVSRLVRERKPILFFGLNQSKLDEQDSLTVSALNYDIFNLCFTIYSQKDESFIRSVFKEFYSNIFLNKGELKGPLHKIFEKFEHFITNLIYGNKIRLNGTYINSWEGGFISNFHYLSAFENSLVNNREIKFSKKQSFGIDKSADLRSLGTLLNSSENRPGAVIFFSQEGYSSFFKEFDKLGVPVISVVNSKESLKNIDFPLFGDTESLKVLQFYIFIIGHTIHHALSSE